MALIPFLFGDPFEFARPSRILDQRFGTCLSNEDLLAPFTPSTGLASLLRLPTGYIRPWRSLSSQQDVGSTVVCDGDGFRASLDVQQFAPEEITVKVTGDDEVTIEGKHEEKRDEHGYVSRRFARRYVLPEGCDINRVESKLSSDGVLRVTVPRCGVRSMEQRQVPIRETGQPSRPIEARK